MACRLSSSDMRAAFLLLGYGNILWACIVCCFAFAKSSKMNTNADFASLTRIGLLHFDSNLWLRCACVWTITQSPTLMFSGVTFVLKLCHLSAHERFAMLLSLTSLCTFSNAWYNTSRLMICVVLASSMAFQFLYFCKGVGCINNGDALKPMKNYAHLILPWVVFTNVFGSVCFTTFCTG